MLETAMNYGYWGLFAVSLLSATLITAPSDVMAMAMPPAGFDPVWVALVATAGGYLGNLVNYAVGRYGTKFFRQKLLQNKTDAPPDESPSPNPKTADENSWQARAEYLYDRYGVFSLLLSGVPFIGDPLTVIAGGFRVNLVVFSILVIIGKLVKFALLLGLIDLFNR
jgi:membrane protein YqaA with SNARE-associated domain